MTKPPAACLACCARRLASFGPGRRCALFEQRPGSLGSQCARALSIDVAEAGDAIDVMAEIAGVRVEDVDISVVHVPKPAEAKSETKKIEIKG